MLSWCILSLDFMQFMTIFNLMANHFDNKNRFDDLFSLEKLRLNWGREQLDRTSSNPSSLAPLTEPTPTSIDSPDTGILAETAKVRALMHKRYQSESLKALEIMMDELKALLKTRFPENNSLSEDEKTSLNPEIEQALSNIEDLVEALDLS